MNKDILCIVGLEDDRVAEIREQIDMPIIAHINLPDIMVKDGELLVESGGFPKFRPVSKVVYHGIYENDLDFIVGLSLWGGASLPTARNMMDCRLKLPCLVRALDHTRFGAPRGYAAPGVMYYTEQERVAKWGNWHCGENKERFTESWSGAEPSIIEPFFAGEAVRVVIIGDQYWQIKLDGDDWLKSIHHDSATFMEVDADLLDDTRTLKQAFGLEIIANDYIVGDDGNKYLLEVNHIPNVTRFPELWAAFRDFVVEWVQEEKETV